MALGLANTAYVLEGGRIRYHGTAAELRENPDLLHSAYLLRDAPSTPAPRAAERPRRLSGLAAERPAGRPRPA